MIRICPCSVPRRCGRLVPRASCSAASLAWSVGTVLRQQDLAMRAVCPSFTSVLLELVVSPALHLIWKGRGLPQLAQGAMT